MHGTSVIAPNRFPLAKLQRVGAGGCGIERYSSCSRRRPARTSLRDPLRLCERAARRGSSARQIHTQPEGPPPHWAGVNRLVALTDACSLAKSLSGLDITCIRISAVDFPNLWPSSRKPLPRSAGPELSRRGPDPGPIIPSDPPAISIGTPVRGLDRLDAQGPFDRG